jgi:hypothetical protein
MLSKISRVCFLAMILLILGHGREQHAAGKGTSSRCMGASELQESRSVANRDKTVRGCQCRYGRAERQDGISGQYRSVSWVTT